MKKENKKYYIQRKADELYLLNLGCNTFGKKEDAFQFSASTLQSSLTRLKLLYKDIKLFKTEEIKANT